MDVRLKNKLTSFIGLFFADPAVRYSLLARFFSFSVAPLTLLGIGAFLEPAEQGVYYVFGSLLQLGAFIDLGFSKSAQQLLAHSYGNLRLNRKDGFHGDQQRLECFLPIAKSVFLTYVILGTILFIAVGTAGHIYLNITLKDELPIPIGPWWTLISAISLAFGLQGIITIADAANLLRISNKWRLISEIVGMLLFLLVLAVGGSLWASAALACSRFIFTVIPITFYLGKKTCEQVIYTEAKDFSYRTEILPLQTRNMITYGMGFLTYYSYTPISLSILGPIAAGVIGMSLQISNIAYNFSTIWFNAQIPLMGNLAGSGSGDELMKLHQRGTKITVVCWILFAISIIPGAHIGKEILPQIGTRYGSVADIALFVVGTGGFTWAHIRAAYLRSFRIEPFASLSIVQAIITVGLLFFTLPLLSATGAAATYAITMILGALWIEKVHRSYLSGGRKVPFQQPQHPSKHVPQIGS